MLLDCRVFHDANFVKKHPKRCCQHITKLLCLFTRGETFSSTEISDVFFGVTKLFQSPDVQTNTTCSALPTPLVLAFTQAFFLSMIALCRATCGAWCTCSSRRWQNRLHQMRCRHKTPNDTTTLHSCSRYSDLTPPVAVHTSFLADYHHYVKSVQGHEPQHRLVPSQLAASACKDHGCTGFCFGA